MGSTVCRAVAADDALELVAAVDPGAAGTPVEGIVIESGRDHFGVARCQVVVDFTDAAAARHSVVDLVAQGVDVVVGTTGLTDADLDALAVVAAREGAGNVVVAANFSISAVLLMRLSPLVPFNLQNYLFGVTDVDFKRYLAATFVGIMPGSLLYVYVGSLGQQSGGGTTGKWIFFALGLIATAITVVLITRKAKARLAEAGVGAGKGKGKAKTPSRKKS